MGNENKDERWRIIENKFENNCCQCRQIIKVREEVLYNKEKGIKHLKGCEVVKEFKREFINKYPVKCGRCKKRIPIGAKIWWRKQGNVNCFQCG